MERSRRTPGASQPVVAANAWVPRGRRPPIGGEHLWAHARGWPTQVGSNPVPCRKSPIRGTIGAAQPVRHVQSFGLATAPAAGAGGSGPLQMPGPRSNPHWHSSPTRAVEELSECRRRELVSNQLALGATLVGNLSSHGTRSTAGSYPVPRQPARADNRRSSGSIAGGFPTWWRQIPGAPTVDDRSEVDPCCWSTAGGCETMGARWCAALEQSSVRRTLGAF